MWTEAARGNGFPAFGRLHDRTPTGREDSPMRTLLQVVVLVTPLLSVDAAVAAELPVAGPLPHAFTASVGARVVLVGGGGMGGHNSGGMGSSQTGGMNGGASTGSGQFGGMSGAQTGGMNGGTTANSRPPGGTS